MTTDSTNLPEGLVPLLQEFTICVLRYKPSDVPAFASDYFIRLRDIERNRAAIEAGELSGKLGINNRGGIPKVRPPLKDRIIEPPVQNRKTKGLTFDPISLEDPYDSDELSDMEAENAEKMASGRDRRITIAAEPYDPDASDEESKNEIDFQEKSTEQMDMLRKVCEKLMIFRELESSQLTLVIKSMFEKNVKPGEVVITQGEEGDNFYVIEKGTFEALKAENGGEPQLIHTYVDQGSFGELALMYNAQRACTVKAKTDGVLWAMNRISFRSLVLKHAAKRRKEFLAHIKSVEIFRELSDYERMNLADAIIKREYEDGEKIIEQGEPGSEFFFICEGKVRVTIKETPKSPEVDINRLEKGQYFGEMALISQKPRAASVYADGKVVLGALGVDGFERLLGPCLDIMKRKASSYSHKLTDTLGGGKMSVKMN